MSQDTSRRFAHTFASITSAAFAIGTLEHVEYQAVIDGIEDSQFVPVDTADLSYELTERGFKDGRDAVRVLLPVGHEMLRAS